MRRGDHLTALALLGAADVASFLALRRREIFAASPARARGSVASLAIWLAVAATSSMATRRPAGKRIRVASAALALLCGLGNVALLAVHLRIRKGRRRSLPGGILGAAVLRSGIHRLVSP